MEMGMMGLMHGPNQSDKPTLLGSQINAADGKDSKDSEDEGLKIEVCGEQLQRLGLRQLPPVGEKYMLHAMVEVCSVEKDNVPNSEPEYSVGFQIISMSINKQDVQIEAGKIFQR